MTSDIDSRLYDDETILWQGKPVRSSVSVSDFVWFFVGLILLTLAIVFLVFVMKSEEFLVEMIFISLFIIFILYLMFGTHIKQKRIIACTNFYITDQRIIFHINMKVTQTRIIDFSNIVMIQKQSKSGSVGNITICAKGPKTRSVDSDDFSAFYMINNVDDVYFLLFQTIQNQKIRS